MIINLFGTSVLRIARSMLCQLDVKLIVAISSIVHVGILLITKLRLYGRYFIIISHGLFYLINLIYNQTNRRLINRSPTLLFPGEFFFSFFLRFSVSRSLFDLRSLTIVKEVTNSLDLQVATFEIMTIERD